MGVCIITMPNIDYMISKMTLLKENYPWELTVFQNL